MTTEEKIAEIEEELERLKHSARTIYNFNKQLALTKELSQLKEQKEK